MLGSRVLFKTRVFSPKEIPLFLRHGTHECLSRLPARPDHGTAPASLGAAGGSAAQRGLLVQHHTPAHPVQGRERIPTGCREKPPPTPDEDGPQ